VLVRIVQAMPNLPRVGTVAWIKAVEYPNRELCTIRAGSNDHDRVPMSILEPVVPERRKRVKVLRGGHRGRLGTLTGIDDAEGVVQLEGEDTYKFIRIKDLGTYRGD
jgi:hypothetical protein